MFFANRLGIRVTLSEFSPIAGTPDGESCRSWVDLDEPLWHNKSAFSIRMLGESEINRLKALSARLNHRLQTPNSQAKPARPPAEGVAI